MVSFSLSGHRQTASIMGRSSTFWRLFGTFGLLWLASIGMLGGIAVTRLDRFDQQHIKEDLGVRARLIQEAVRGCQPGDLQQKVDGLGQYADMRITLLDPDGHVLADSEENKDVMEDHAQRPEVLEAREKGIGTDVRHSHTVNRDMVYVAVRTDPPDPNVAFVRVALSCDKVQQEIAALTWIVWTAAAITGLVALGLAFWLARRTVRPLRELTEAARHIGSGSYGHTVYAPGSDEVALLGQTFNEMSTRLAVQFTQLEEDREQLRTILSGMIEGVIALDAGERILFVNDRAARLLEFQAQAAVGRRLWEVVRLRALQDVVRRALASSEVQFEELKWGSTTSRTLTAHAARLGAGSADTSRPRAEPCWCCTIPPSCAAWNACARTSWPMSRTN